MDKDKALLAVVILGGAAFYLMSKQKKCSCNKATFIPMSIDSIEKDEDKASTNVKVDAIVPRFGVPRNILPPQNTPPVFKNYIDVQKNSYFKPKMGAFFR
jgi:hypothetical protein